VTGRHFSRVFAFFLCLLPLCVAHGGALAAPAIIVADVSAMTAGPGSTPVEAEGVPVSAAPEGLPAAQSPDSASLIAADRVAAAMTRGGASYTGPVSESWQPLLRRLEKDPRVRPESLRFFHGLPEYSPAPMGVKIKELFTNAFLRKRPVDDGRPKPPPSRIYRNVVTAATVQNCREYLIRHKDIFDAVEKKYPVPREILAALLFVETRLGTYVGRNLALWSLASMAAADTPERMAGGLDGIPITGQHKDWLQAKLTERSRWAYNELRALLEYFDTHDLDPFQVPGSVFGAIGISQFMPSNIVPYGESASGDGMVNLFTHPDAIFSAARYLTKHGWSKGLSVERQRAVLRRYNNLTIYANTILALAESIRTGVLQTGPPDMVKPAAAAPGKPASSGAAPATSRTVIVRAGDTLSGIARANGVSVRALQEANKMGSDTRIRTGQRLAIP
jgi:membrane-bound lytic murein transglycosylase B